MATGQSDAERELRALSDAFVRHFNAGDAERLTREFYTEDAHLLPPNLPTVTGRSGIGAAFREFLEAGMGELTVDTYDVHVAESGDLAYGTGTFSLGRPAPDRGKFLEVYRRQADGSWRCVADMFSSDQAAT
jgi:ketosteroid isomerase-like protein